jgi:carbon storage regulator
MLVITRRKDQETVIHDPVTGFKARIVIVNTANGNVKLGIDAPKNIIIDRKEVYEKRSVLSLVG